MRSRLLCPKDQGHNMSCASDQMGTEEGHTCSKIVYIQLKPTRNSEQNPQTDRRVLIQNHINWRQSNAETIVQEIGFNYCELIMYFLLKKTSLTHFEKLTKLEKVVGKSHAFDMWVWAMNWCIFNFFLGYDTKGDEQNVVGSELEAKIFVHVRWEQRSCNIRFRHFLMQMPHFLQL